MALEVAVSTRGGELLRDCERTAVVVVDMQNDFVSEGGMFDQNGVPTAAVRTVVPTIQQVLDAARDQGIPVVYLKMGYQPYRNYRSTGIPCQRCSSLSTPTQSCTRSPRS